MNTVTLIGNLTRDPELRYSEQGTAVAALTVAVSRRRRRNGAWTDQLDGYFDVVPSRAPPSVPPRRCTRATGCWSPAGSARRHTPTATAPAARRSGSWPRRSPRPRLPPPPRATAAASGRPSRRPRREAWRGRPHMTQSTAPVALTAERRSRIGCPPVADWRATCPSRGGSEVLLCSIFSGSAGCLHRSAVRYAE